MQVRHGKLGLGKGGEDILSPRKVRLPTGTRVKQASAWHAHSLVVSTAGELFSFGCGQRGRLGHGDERGRCRPGLVHALSDKELRCHVPLLLVRERARKVHSARRSRDFDRCLC